MLHSSGRPVRQWFAYAGTLVVAFVVFPVVFLFLHGACEKGLSDPEDPTVLTVLFRNASAENIHILGPGEVKEDGDPPGGNRLVPGATREWSSESGVRAGDLVSFSAVRLGTPLATASCTVTQSDLDLNPRPELRYREVGAESFLDCF